MHLTNVTSCYLIRVTSLDIGFGRKTITWRKVKDNNVSYFRQTVAKFKFQPLNDSGVTYMEGDILTFRYFQCESGTSIPFDFDVLSDDGIAGSFSIDEVQWGLNIRTSSDKFCLDCESLKGKVLSWCLNYKKLDTEAPQDTNRDGN